ncbi:hypothetical protein N7453_010874 [Penicillium expansum]|nr:hypothetical protein N7453_010874 [Penicillium expansum]
MQCDAIAPYLFFFSLASRLSLLFLPSLSSSSHFSLKLGIACSSGNTTSGTRICPNPSSSDRFTFQHADPRNLIILMGKKDKQRKEHNLLTRDQHPIKHLFEEHYMHLQIFNSPLDSTEFLQARFIRS